MVPILLERGTSNLNYVKGGLGWTPVWWKGGLVDIGGWGNIPNSETGVSCFRKILFCKAESFGKMVRQEEKGRKQWRWGMRSRHPDSGSRSQAGMPELVSWEKRKASTVIAIDAPVRGPSHQVGSRGSWIMIDADKGFVGSPIFHVFYILFWEERLSMQKFESMIYYTIYTYFMKCCRDWLLLRWFWQWLNLPNGLILLKKKAAEDVQSWHFGL